MPTKNHFNIKQDGKTFGVLSDNVLRIIKTSPNHYVNKFKGYGISPSTLDEAEAKGYTLLELIGYDGEKFLLPIRDFRKGAIPADIGRGEQLFLAVRWLRLYSRQYQEAINPKPQQARMF